MTGESIALVQRSFAEILPIADTAAALFYEYLFDLDPSLRSLFHSNMPEQGRKLMAMLQIAVDGLSHLEDLMPLVQQLGKRHQAYGVHAAHYDTVGLALLWTLKQGLQERFTPEVQAAWTSLYTLLADTMRAAATPKEDTRAAALAL
jgi:hemoglobin-like flavoprotein